MPVCIALFQVLVQATNRLPHREVCERRTVSEMYLENVTLKDPTSALEVSLCWCACKFVTLFWHTLLMQLGCCEGRTIHIPATSSRPVSSHLTHADGCLFSMCLAGLQ